MVSHFFHDNYFSIRLSFSVLSHHTVSVYSDISEKHCASIFRVTDSGSGGCYSNWQEECVG